MINRLSTLERIIYSESVTSKRTTLFFIILAILFMLSMIYHVAREQFDALAGILTGIFVFFIFYAVNFRILKISLTKDILTLYFGIFTWAVPIENITEAQLDHLPLLKRYGGAGIHFMFIRKRYRVSCNFLEHPRVVVALKKKIGPVQDISFSTCHPDEVIQHIQKAIAIRLKG